MVQDVLDDRLIDYALIYLLWGPSPETSGEFPPKTTMSRRLLDGMRMKEVAGCCKSMTLMNKFLSSSYFYISRMLFFPLLPPTTYSPDSTTMV